MHPPLVALAGRQYGVVTRAQLLAMGLGTSAIQYQRETGRLIPIHAGVYAVGYLPKSPLSWAMAAVLASDGVLSHRSAAALWQIQPGWRGPVEVTASHRHRLRGVLVHRARSLPVAVSCNGIPTTTVPRTLLDLAEVLGDRALTRAVNEARLHYSIGTIEPHSGRRGAARLKALIRPAEAPTRSALEDAFLEFADRYRLPRPEVNVRVEGFEVDILWRVQRVVVELDGRAFHGHAGAFERDRDRDAELTAAGFRVVRITWRRLAEQPERELQRLRAILGLAAA